MKWRLPVIATLWLGSSLGSVALAGAMVGTAVVARADGDALIIWDATPAVVAIVSNKTDDVTAMRQLESSAVTIAASHAKDLTDASTISVRITYAKTGAVNPAYGAATFAGIERVATVRLSRDAALTSAALLASEIASGKTVPNVAIVVSGKLPPH
jgi:hypothetical protein